MHTCFDICKKGFEGEYFPSSEKTSKGTNSSVREYKSINLTSKSTEDTLVYFLKLNTINNVQTCTCSSLTITIIFFVNYYYYYQVII